MPEFFPHEAKYAFLVSSQSVPCFVCGDTAGKCHVGDTWADCRHKASAESMGGMGWRHRLNGKANQKKTYQAEPEEQHQIVTTTAADLQCKMFEPPKEIICGLILEGLTVLAARPKKGKSWLMLLMSLGVSFGWPNICGYFIARKGDVLYVALEDSERRMQGRSNTLIGDLLWPENLHFAYKWRRLDKGGLEDLRTWLKDHPDCVMVVLDTYTRIKPPKGRNADSYAEDAAWTAALQEIALEFRCAIVLVMHQRKMASDDPFDSVSGTLGNTASADGILILERKGKTSGTLMLTGRDVEEKTFAMEFGGGVWTCSGEVDTEDEEDTDPLAGVKDFVLQMLKDGPATSESIFTEGKNLGFSKKKIYQAKDALKIKARKSGFSNGWSWELPMCVKEGESSGKFGVSSDV